MTTIKDVAKAAGVSAITVSRVINKPDSVKESTRIRVQEVMKDLRYVTNAAARSLVSNRTGIIDVFVPESIDISNPFVMHFIAGISSVLSRKMYSFLILRNREQEHLCDGYIVTGLLRNEVQDFEKYAGERHRPLLLFGHEKSDYIDCIDVDNVAGSQMGVEYLLSLGHKRIAMINVAEDKDYTDDRLEGYRKALENAGLTFDRNDVLYTVNSPEGGAQAVQKLLVHADYSAVFCATDTIGIGVTTELIKYGYRVPEDISILGFDGLGHNLLVTPALTSIQQPVYEIGEMLARALLDKLDGKEIQHSVLVMPKLLMGGSVSESRGTPVRRSGGV